MSTDVATLNTCPSAIGPAEIWHRCRIFGASTPFLRNLVQDETSDYARGQAHYGIAGKQLPDLACPIVRFRRFGKGYIVVLCTPCRALKTNDIAVQSREVVFCRLLRS
jgi:hypothetical protein